MEAVILAGGYGTRISEESVFRPKPMIEIGGKPILWHIMKIYSHYGINDFIVCCGYKSYYIKEYFMNYFMHSSDLNIDLANNQVEYHNSSSEPWKLKLIDTGLDTMTGGRLKYVRDHIKGERFHMTYGDGVSNVDLDSLEKYHIEKNASVTLTGVKPPGRFGQLKIENGMVDSFREKPEGDGAYINGGFFVVEKKIIDNIDGPQTVWEQEPLREEAKKGQLAVYKHEGFWQPMDTLREKNSLERLWSSGEAPWKVW